MQIGKLMRKKFLIFEELKFWQKQSRGVQDGHSLRSLWRQQRKNWDTKEKIKTY